MMVVSYVQKIRIHQEEDHALIVQQDHSLQVQVQLSVQYVIADIPIIMFPKSVNYVELEHSQSKEDFVTHVDQITTLELVNANVSLVTQDHNQHQMVVHVLNVIQEHFLMVQEVVNHAQMESILLTMVLLNVIIVVVEKNQLVIKEIVFFVMQVSLLIMEHANNVNLEHIPLILERVHAFPANQVLNLILISLNV